MKLTLLSLAVLVLSGCFRITGVEHSIYGGMSRSYSGGEVYSESPSGHQEQSGGWTAGTKIKTIWANK